MLIYTLGKCFIRTVLPYAVDAAKVAYEGYKGKKALDELKEVQAKMKEEYLKGTPQKEDK